MSAKSDKASQTDPDENPASAYDMQVEVEPLEQRTLAAVVDNEPGVLARVVGLFSARGYNIESLTVAVIDRRAARSRITIVTSGTAHILEQIEAQLGRLVPVAEIFDVTRDPKGIQRELALIKVRSTGESRIEALRLSEIFRGRVIDTTSESFIFEITGSSAKIDQFIELMRPLGLVEIGRTGVLSLTRGSDGEFEVQEEA